LDKLELEKIIKSIMKDDESSFKILFDYYYPKLFYFSKRFLKVERGIDDIIQEVFVKIWQNRKTINSVETFNSFIFTITKNLLLNELRSLLNKENIKKEIYNISVAKEYSSINNIEYHELQQKIDSVINKLSKRQKEIFILSRKKGLSNKEIAKKFKISTKTVEYHITLAIKFIKKELGDLGLISLLYFFLFF